MPCCFVSALTNPNTKISNPSCLRHQPNLCSGVAKRFTCRRPIFATVMPPARPEATNLTVSRSTSINVGELLGACIDAVRRSCAVIRDVQTARESGKSIGASYKDVSDPRSALTIADTMAQACIVPQLRLQFPGLQVIAEEEEGDQDFEGSKDVTALGTTNMDLETPQHLRSVAVEDICVFCDPLDGTLEFVKGRLDAVQSLVGICYKGEPVAGVIGRPFAASEPIYGMVGAGIRNLPPSEEREKRSGLVLATSHSSVKPIIKAAIDVISPDSILAVGGAGNKMLQVAMGKADMSVLNLITSLWDTAAPGAIVMAMGGTLTDFFGNPIQHFASSRITNCYGVLASGSSLAVHDIQERNHKAVCKQLRESMVLDGLLAEVGLESNGQPQATDVALDLDGNPLTTQWLSNIFKSQVSGYSAEESTAVRYLMSDACRICLKYKDNEASGPKSFFMKRIVMRHLEHVKLKARTAPKKLERDVTSYQVEAAFLSSKACYDLRQSGTRIARAYHVDSRPAPNGSSPIESRFLLMLEDFNPQDGWSQVGLLDRGRMQCTMNTLASIHAYFWNYTTSGAYEELSHTVWDQATYWLPSRQSADSFDKLSACWEKHLKNFATDLETLDISPNQKVNLGNLGRVLAEIAPSCAEKVHRVGLEEGHPHRTIIHGDAKAANFFYRLKQDATGSSSNQWEVGVIDFQWCGWGHPAVDVAYLIAASAAPELLTHDGAGEEELLKSYYDSLCHYLVEYGKAANLSCARQMMAFSDFADYYDEALLDLARLVISYHWDRIKASPEVLEKRKDVLGSNAYNKNIKCAMWLVARTVSLLQKRDISYSIDHLKN